MVGEDGVSGMGGVPGLTGTNGIAVGEDGVW